MGVAWDHPSGLSTLLAEVLFRDLGGPFQCRPETSAKQFATQVLTPHCQRRMHGSVADLAVRGNTKPTQVRPPGKINTGTTRTKRHFPAHDGTTDKMPV